MIAAVDDAPIVNIEEVLTVLETDPVTNVDLLLVEHVKRVTQFLES